MFSLLFSFQAYSSWFDKIYDLSFKGVFEPILVGLKLKQSSCYGSVKIPLSQQELENLSDVDDIYKKIVKEALQSMSYNGPEIMLKEFPEDIRDKFSQGWTNGKVILVDLSKENVNNEEVYFFSIEFTLYHECAHIALDHNHKNRKSIEKELEADQLAVKALCQNGKKEVVVKEMNNLEMKARASAKRWIEQNSICTSYDCVYSSGLAFAFDQKTKSIGDPIGYINCTKCGIKGCDQCKNHTHPSLGRRYFLWKQLLEEYEKGQLNKSFVI